MKVKNILINEKNEFIELLIRELIKYEIGYVHIDNEIHFDNYIFRFYDIQDDKEKIRRIIDEDVLKIEIIKVNDLEEKINYKNYQSYQIYFKLLNQKKEK